MSWNDLCINITSGREEIVLSEFSEELIVNMKDGYRGFIRIGEFGFITIDSYIGALIGVDVDIFINFHHCYVDVGEWYYKHYMYIASIIESICAKNILLQPELSLWKDLTGSDNLRIEEVECQNMCKQICIAYLSRYE